MLDLPAQHEPVWLPILTRTISSGRCLILKAPTEKSISNDMSAITPDKIQVNV